VIHCICATTTHYDFKSLLAQHLSYTGEAGTAERLVKRKHESRKDCYKIPGQEKMWNMAMSFPESVTCS